MLDKQEQPGRNGYETLNGQKTIMDAYSDKFAKWRITFQRGKGVIDESGIVKFRKVQVKAL
jgi:hypothetical protein